MDSIQIDRLSARKASTLKGFQLGMHPNWNNSNLESISFWRLPYRRTSKLAVFQLQKHPSWKPTNWESIHVGDFPIRKASKLTVFQLEKRTGGGFQLENQSSLRSSTGKAIKLVVFQFQKHSSWKPTNWESIQVGDLPIRKAFKVAVFLL